MDIQITSLSDIEREACRPFPPGTALISIGDVGAKPPTLRYQPDHVLYLQFEDISLSEMDYENSGKYAFYLFSREQAREIADFIYCHRPHIQTLICQCHFGQSRSAAVAAAVKEHFFHNGIDIFADEQERYCPNPYVFRTTLKALNEKAEP